jgi:UDP-N-acetylglucosamine acyltransferase
MPGKTVAAPVPPLLDSSALQDTGAVMSKAQLSRIHPTAVISAEAELADDVQVGPYVVIEGRVRIGAGCVLRPYVHLCGPLTMGCGNMVYSGCVLGERPQHLRYNDEPTSLEIGDDNIFREHVTIHRGTTQAWATRIGSHNFLMAHSHVAHDCQIGNRCILANGALVGGHCIVEDNVYLSGNSAVHQFVRIGRLALLSGCSATTKDIPPFVIQQNIDTVVAINVVGMRRAGMSNQQINAVRTAFRILFRDGLVLPAALAKLERELGAIDVVGEMISFLRQSPKGINPMRSRGRMADAA